MNLFWCVFFPVHKMRFSATLNFEPGWGSRPGIVFFGPSKLDFIAVLLEMPEKTQDPHVWGVTMLIMFDDQPTLTVQFIMCNSDVGHRLNLFLSFSLILLAVKSQRKNMRFTRPLVNIVCRFTFWGPTSFNQSHTTSVHDVIHNIPTRWGPTSCKWSYNPYK